MTQHSHESSQPTFPCLLLKLEPGDGGYVAGYRYRVDQDDPEDQHYFHTRKRAEQFVDLHGFTVVSANKMKAIRDEL